VADAGSVLLDNLWINLQVVEGDGTMVPSDSVLTNGMGLGHVSYNFSGLLGHAIVRGNFRTVDTVEAYLRANTIIPGVGGQGQYILLSELYFDVKNFNGEPAAEAEDSAQWLCYADYESSLNVVFVIQDTNHTGFPEEIEHVYAIILTSGYTEKTKDSIGIGSTYNELKSVFGVPDFVMHDPTPPPALRVDFDSYGLTFYLNPVSGTPMDTNVTVFEIHMDDNISRRAPGKAIQKNSLSIGDSTPNYRRFQR
jgi:hypothetical protein